MRIKLWGFLFAVLPVCYGAALPDKPDPKYKLLPGRSYVQSKNYYLLTLFEELPEVRTFLERDPVLAEIARAKYETLGQALTDCREDFRCYTGKMKFSEAEIRQVGERLKELCKDKNVLDKLVRDHLIPSGTYVRFESLPRPELLKNAWEREAGAVNYAISVYGEGRKPNYPAIDSISLRVNSLAFLSLVHDTSDLIRQELKKDSALFFTIPLRSGLRFLELNERNEAADFEPMHTTVNRAAYQHSAKTDWSKYKYTLILVPGAGPDSYERALSEGGIVRCRLAALRYFEGLAPFILVSGGRVHPYKTRYSEAFEMKKYLTEVLDVPEHAVIMDPHARHTTTNLRNAVRLLFRYGMPMDKPCLVATVRSQSFYITAASFEKRCKRELELVPYRPGERISDTLFEFYPAIEALQLDADEPLDP